jgi:allantoicase
MVAVGQFQSTLNFDIDSHYFTGNHEANCDNGANFALCLPGQMNFTGYRHHWKYVTTP